jgi:DNA-binding GntR family transcriptional regulator
MDSPLTEHAYTLLRKEILSLGLPPGVEVSEQRLVSDFGLSKASVRAALARLRADGLVTAIPRRGHQVAPVTLRDINEVFQLRILLEPEAAALAAGNITERELRPTVARDYNPRSRTSIHNFLKANRELHVRVADASGSRRLARTIAQLLDEGERAVHLALAAGAGQNGLRIIHEHDELIDALIAGNPSGARHSMTVALESFRVELMAVLVDTDAVLDTSL